MKWNFVPDVGLFGGVVPWKEATLARIPEKQTQRKTC